MGAGSIPDKTVTTGEGGMVLAEDAALAARLRIAKGQGQSLHRRYWHEVMGFNYRMTNIAAAIGLAQTERLAAIMRRKREVGALYLRLLAGAPVTFQHCGPGVDKSEWLVTVLLPAGTDRAALMAAMEAAGVETRPVFYPAHTMPMYARGESFPVAEAIAARGISLPSFPGLTEEEIRQVCRALTDAL